MNKLTSWSPCRATSCLMWYTSPPLKLFFCCFPLPSLPPARCSLCLAALIDKCVFGYLQSVCVCVCVCVCMCVWGGFLYLWNNVIILFPPLIPRFHFRNLGEGGTRKLDWSIGAADKHLTRGRILPAADGSLFVCLFVCCAAVTFTQMRRRSHRFCQMSLAAVWIDEFGSFDLDDGFCVDKFYLDYFLFGKLRENVGSWVFFVTSLQTDTEQHVTGEQNNSLFTQTEV